MMTEFTAYRLNVSYLENLDLSKVVIITVLYISYETNKYSFFFLKKRSIWRWLKMKTYNQTKNDEGISILPVIYNCSRY